jgi:hypothetical protein
VYVVWPLSALDVSPPFGDAEVFQTPVELLPVPSPLVPVTVQLCALLTLQDTLTVSPGLTSVGETCKLLFIVMTGWEQVDKPFWQKLGETQLVTFVTLHEESVYWMVLPEQEYAGAQATPWYMS